MDLIFTWVDQHTGLAGVIAITSLLLLVLTVIATPWLVAQLPNDYLINQQRRRRANRLLDGVITTTRVVIGLLLSVLGLVMMVTPGPGIVMLLIGLSVAEFPGKKRLIRALATQPRVFASLTWMRKRYNKPPFDLPPTKLE